MASCTCTLLFVYRRVDFCVEFLLSLSLPVSLSLIFLFSVFKCFVSQLFLVMIMITFLFPLPLVLTCMCTCTRLCVSSEATVKRPLSVQRESVRVGASFSKVTHETCTCTCIAG